MTVTVGQVVWALLVSGAVILVLAFLTVRSTRTLHPVRCVHCRFRFDRETVITYSEKPDQWAICPDCLKYYWTVQDP